MWIMGEGGGAGWMGGSWTEPDLTNELIARGGTHSPTSLLSSLIRICKEQKSVGKIFLDSV